MLISRFRYTPLYCEENVWQLCDDPRVPGDDKQVVFISNAARRVAMWGQKAARDPHDPVVWDYHVILVSRSQIWRVWDLDSALGLDVSFESWCSASFEVSITPEAFRPQFRCIEADVYRTTFASDRRHMRLPDGTDASPPPAWPCIGRGHNLDQFVDMRDEGGPGELLDFEGVCRRFGGS
jgi:protein N-terminal glutamine amidohydrolase